MAIPLDQFADLATQEAVENLDRNVLLEDQERKRKGLYPFNK